MTSEEQQESVSLREFIERTLNERDRIYGERFTSQKDAVAAALASAKEAVTKAEMAAEKRFEGVNELRGMANDILAKTMTRVEAEAELKAFDAKLVAVVESWDKRHQEVVDRTVALEKANVAVNGANTERKETVDNSRANLALVVSLILGAILILEFAWNVLSPVITKILLTK
jgi:phosphopantetheinyl transferase (holo-ACP synthase)